MYIIIRRVTTVLRLVVLCIATLNAAAVADTKFEYGRGFYDTSFNEIITSETDGADIWYTLDGSDPRYSTTALLGISPLSITIDPESTNDGRPKTPGVTVRACAKKSGMKDTDVDTHTYLFISHILQQSNVSPGVGWPEPPSKKNAEGEDHGIDYEMNPDVVNDPQWGTSIADALQALPSISIVSDLDSIFGKERGFYVNSKEEGKESERPVSMELIFPYDSVGFQVNAGIRIRGNFSAKPEVLKHSFRLFFRSEYGDAKLDYPLFGGEGVDKYDKIDLRTSQNYAWHRGGSKYVFARDVFSRDLQRETGNAYTRSRYYNLYINGMYWGLYQTEERPEARYAASYFGGQESDYDVLKTDNYTSLVATDGTTDLYQEFWDGMKNMETRSDYFKLMGKKEDGSDDPKGKKLLDPENLIDFLLTTYYSANSDGQPLWLNNYFCLINRENPDGYKYFRHDSEHSLDANGDIHNFEHETGLDDLEELKEFLPHTMIGALMEIDEFKILFKDRFYRFYFNDGIMTDDSAKALINRRFDRLLPAIYAESARWGDGTGDKTKKEFDFGTWMKAVEDVLTFMTGRNTTVVNGIKERGWYPKNLDPPMVRKNTGVEVTRRLIQFKWYDTVSLSNEDAGTIYYTTDGSDPRAIGGAPSKTAIDGGDSTDVTLEGPVLKTRKKIGDEWSALREHYMFSGINKHDIRITEIHYNPMGEFIGDSLIDEKEFEFIEIKNVAAYPIVMTGARFSSGVIYNFPEGFMLYPNEYAVICNNPKLYTERYGVEPVGDYQGVLSNGGEALTLVDIYDGVIDQVVFSDKAPWPDESDGLGRSLTMIDHNEEYLSGIENWTVSKNMHGTPGEESEIDSAEYLPSSSSEVSSSSEGLPLESSSEFSSDTPSSSEEISPIDKQSQKNRNLHIKIVAHFGNSISINAPASAHTYSVVTIRGEHIASNIFVEGGFAHIAGGTAQGALVITFR